MNGKLNLFAIAALLLLVTSCSHETSIVDGPLIIDRFGDFRLIETLEAATTDVDFAAGNTVVFTAQFSKQVSWVLELTGQTSGAVKRIEGFSNALNADNASWNGSTTELPFFKAENVTATLTIDDDNADVVTTTLAVATPRTYEGSLVADFEQPGGADIFVGNFEFEFDAASGRSDEVPAAQGDFFYLFRGTDRVVPNFFTGLIDIKASITGETYFPVPTTIPENLFFNMFLYSFGSDHTIAVVQLIIDSNNTGAFEDGQDTVVPYGDLPVDWEGWQHFHKPLSELGISEAQAQQLVAVRVLLISDRNTQPNPPLPVDFGLDFITFTANGPLEL